MKVLILINSLRGGGAEKQMLLAAINLSREGVECHVHWLESDRFADSLRELVEQARKLGVSFWPPRSLVDLSTRLAWTLYSRLRHEPGTILWTWGYRADLVAVVLRLLGCRNGIVGSMRSANEKRIEHHKWLWKVIAITHDVFISNSARNRDQIGAVAPRVLRKTKVIYNIIEERYFEYARGNIERPDRLRVVMLGNQSCHTKGYDIAVSVGELIRENGWPIEIMIGGVPSDLDALRHSIRTKGISHIIKECGQIVNSADFLSSGHIFLMLSRVEGMPNALLEAMAMGIPSICTPVGDVPTFAKEQQCLRLIDFSAVTAITAIVDLWTNWAKTQEMAEVGREFCRERFRAKVMTPILLSVCQNMVQKRQCAKTNG